MPPLHKEILTEKQAGLLPFLKRFSSEFGLVGGTAVALQIGHRESIDYDLFTKDPDAPFKIAKLKTRIGRVTSVRKVLVEEGDEFTLYTKSDIKITMYHFPYRIPFTVPLDKTKTSLMMPDLVTLAAMKGFALGQRAKWKDYVDFYFITKEYSLREIADRAHELFGNEFNEKLLRGQLAYFDDISYAESVVFKPGFEVSEEEVKTKLIEVSLSL